MTQPQPPLLLDCGDGRAVRSCFALESSLTQPFLEDIMS